MARGQRMNDPILVEVTRGKSVESRHRGAYVACDAYGRVVVEAGDIDRPVFPRSAVKAIQALPFLESGAADAFGFTNREIAMACASHNGEEAHVAAARAMLEAAGIGEDALECGAHWSSDETTFLSQSRSMDAPGAIHNNCSGKHASFLCACRHAGLELKGYVKAGHEYQRMIAATMTEVTGVEHDERNMGIDGCAIPTYAVPLRALAQGFARMATGQGIAQGRAIAAHRALRACMAEPFYVAGSRRFDTRLMQEADGRIFVKVGAEGVFCAAVPELGIGIALKCEDGAPRAAEAMIASVLAKVLPANDPFHETLAGFRISPVLNRNGEQVGEIRPAGLLAE